MDSSKNIEKVVRKCCYNFNFDVFSGTWVPFFILQEVAARVERGLFQVL